MEETDKTVPPQPKRIVWWKVGVGAFLVLMEIKDRLLPDPNMPDVLKASNADQQLGMDIATGIICFVGLWLVFTGVRSAWTGPSK
ncbi:MAG: hypothetical protein ABR912_02475 [Terracidiphilus sp.]|jgi:hypothetical protein